MSMIIFTLNYIHEYMYILTYMYTHISCICMYMYIFIYTLSIYTHMYVAQKNINMYHLLNFFMDIQGKKEFSFFQRKLRYY